MRRIHLFFVLTLVCCSTAWCGPAWSASALADYDIYFAAEKGGQYIRSTDHKFSCEDLIYLFVKSPNQALAGARLETEWKNPATGMVHKTSKTFRLARNKKRYWAWGGIEFLSGEGGLELLSEFLDPAAGMTKFIGEWKVRARVAGLVDRELSMRVLC